jgi:hypothetical protein
LGLKVVYAKLSDLDIPVEHRLNMWRDMTPDFRNIESKAHTREWVREKLTRGELVGFVARASDGIG